MIRRILVSTAIAGLAFMGTAAVASADTMPQGPDPISGLLGGLLGGAGGGDPLSAVTGLLGGAAGGGDPLSSVTGLLGGAAGAAGAVPGLSSVTGAVAP